MAKRAAFLAAACSALAIAAMQPANAADYIKVLDPDRVVQAWNVTVGEVESADVYAATGEEIGDVEDVLMTPDGDIVGLSAEAGGFVGLGEKEVAFDIAALIWDGERVIVRMTEEQIGALPDWD